MTDVSSALPANGLAGFVELHGEALVAAVVAIAGLPRHDAEDVTQDVIARALERGVPTEAHADTFRWLRRVARNRAVRDAGTWYRRNVVPHPEPVPDGDGTDPAERAERAERQRVVRAALATLPSTYREVLVRRYLHDEPPRVIADALGEPVTAVKSRLQRAVASFAREVRRSSGGNGRIGTK